MREEDSLSETPIEPHAIVPKKSIISMESISPKRSNHYKNLKIIKILNNGKSPIMLAYAPDKEQHCVMKLFFDQNEGMNFCFENEIRFTSLSHPNVIKSLFYERNRTIHYENSTFEASIILTELAPYGDFFDVVTTYKQHLNETLIRTYFTQLIEGLDYLHKKKVAHLDLKPENLFLGENFILKIADFDLSCFTDDIAIIAKGTENYRAPEVIESSCNNGQTADIYSAGIILFVMKSGGMIPFTENGSSMSVNLCDLFYNDNDAFWQKHCKIQRKQPSEFSRDFRELFIGMTKKNQKERWNLEEIKNSNWYNGPVMTNEEIVRYLKPIVKPKNV